MRVQNTELRNTYLNKEVIEKNNVSETELTDYIKRMRIQLKQMFKASHILVKTEKEADDVLARLAKGEDFAKLAAKVSLDTRNNKTGGDLGPINIREIPAEAAELEKVILSLKAGESGKLKGRFGVSVIKIVSRTVNKKVAIDNELQFKLQDKLVKQKRQTALNDKVKELKSKAKVVIKEDALKKLSEMPKSPEGKNNRNRKLKMRNEELKFKICNLHLAIFLFLLVRFLPCPAVKGERLIQRRCLYLLIIRR